MNTQTLQLSALLCLNQLPLKDRRGLLDFFSQGVAASEIRERILKENLWDRAEKLTSILLRFDPQKEIEDCARRGIHLLTLLDSDYPEMLRQIYHPPAVLYVKGRLVTEDQYSMAVVGTRHPSFYGLEQTRRFVSDLSQKGLTIVSGLAKGIDHAAHEAALQVSYGRTVGVLGCGLDFIYPPGSERLYEKISERGAVVSEYPLGTQPLARHFPERNRIIAGLSLGVLVVEAHYRSGALITAHEAIEEGRDVFAIPGPVNQLTSKGTHRLLKEGAYLAESPEDVMEVIAGCILANSSFSATRADDDESASSTRPSRLLTGQAGHDSKVESPPSLSLRGSETTEAISEEDKKLLEILKTKNMSPHEWIELSGMPSWKAMSQLTLLEIQKKVMKQSDGTYQLA